MDLLSRHAEVLWRLGPDRVLARRIGSDGLDLVGAAAMVWVALDEPTDLESLSSELRGLSAEPVDVASAIAELMAVGLIVRT